MQENERYREAKRRILIRKHKRQKKGFYLHLMVYIGVIMFLVFLTMSNPMNLRTLILMLIWGTFLMGHGLSVFNRKGELHAERQREILELEMDRIKEEDEAFEELDLEEKRALRKEWDDKDLV